LTSQYKNNKSVAKNPTISIDADDPRVSWENLKQTQSRIGSEFEIIGDEGRAVLFSGSFSNSSAIVTDKNVVAEVFSPIVIPPMGNKPPKTYPGGSGPVVIVPTDPANVSAVWSGNDLVITFDWDYANELNDTVSQFIVELTSGGVAKRTPANTFIPNTTQTAQTITVTKAMITSMFNVFRTSFSSICVLTGDPLNNISSTICAATVPTYTLSLPVPIITVSAIASGYSVAYTSPTDDIYDAIDIVEYESTSATEPTGVTYTRTYLGTINPANVISSGTNKRWVKARFSSDAGVYTAFSAAQAVTPTSPVVADNEGPANVASVTATGSLDLDGVIGFNGHATISWASVTGNGIRGYRIRWRQVATPPTAYSYLDSPGTGTTYHLLGLGVGLEYEFAVATYDEYNNTSTQYVAGNNITITGTPYIAGTVDVSGFFRAKANPTDADSTAFKFGYGVDTGKRGLVFNANNYWYIDSDQSASLKVGGATTNFIRWDGSDFLIDGNISARKGTFSGNVTIAPGGSLQSFITPPTVFSISAVTYTASTATYTTTANHGYIVGDDILISGLLPEGYNGKFRITAQTLTTFTVTNTTNAAVTDAIGSVIIITGAGFVLNKDGLAFNSSITRDITTINSETGLFTTKSANIGGWNVDSSSISRSGTANISLNSTSGNISVSAQNIASYTSGINGPVVSTGSTPVDNINGTPVGAENVFWAGTGGATGTSNAFRVTLAGNLYASNAKITGTISSVGALGTMTMDGEHGYMSLQTAGVDAPVSYLVPRNNNIYLTAPSTTAPWSTGKQIASSGPTNGPYISAGSSYKDYWGNTTTGTGIFVGAWDYFSTGASKPFITATDTGIQLSVSPDLGLLLDRGDATLTANKLNPAVASGTPSMLFYTAKQSGAPYSPTTAYGAWAAFTNNKIKLTAAETVFVNVDGTVGSENIEIASTANIWQKFTSTAIQISASSTVWQKFNSSGIRLQSTNSVYQEFDGTSITLVSGNTANTTSEISAYGGGSKITVNGSKVSITGIPRASAFDMGDYRVGTAGAGSYRNASPLGYPPRQRMVIEDPVSGEAQLGMAVYYLDNTQVNTTTPSNTMGVQGDLVVVF
jgi:hypothetical protein